jgi:hypothetical protein
MIGAACIIRYIEWFRQAACQQQYATSRNSGEQAVSLVCLCRIGFGLAVSGQVSGRFEQTSEAAGVIRV